MNTNSRGFRYWIFSEVQGAFPLNSLAKQFGFDNITVIRHNVFDFLDICKRKYDIIFADPPYAIEGLDTIPGRAIGFLSEIGTLILEHPGTYSFSSEPGFIKERKYGNVHFSFFGHRD